MTFEELLNVPPFSMNRAEKAEMLTGRLTELTRLHRDRCPAYARMLETAGFDPDSVRDYREIPFLPVSLFKTMELRSVEKEEVVKTMTSSGTTGQAVSRIYLDRTTSANQQKTMVKIVSDFTGSGRMPMITS